MTSLNLQTEEVPACIATQPPREVMLVVNGLDCPSQAAQAAFELALQTGAGLTVLYLKPPTGGTTTPTEAGWVAQQTHLRQLADHYQFPATRLHFEQSDFVSLGGLERLARHKGAGVVVLACHQWPLRVWLVD